jgi:hypothetical protein
MKQVEEQQVKRDALVGKLQEMTERLEDAQQQLAVTQKALMEKERQEQDLEAKLEYLKLELQAKVRFSLHFFLMFGAGAIVYRIRPVVDQDSPFDSCPGVCRCHHHECVRLY